MRSSGNQYRTANRQEWMQTAIVDLAEVVLFLRFDYLGVPHSFDRRNTHNLADVASKQKSTVASCLMESGSSRKVTVHSAVIFEC